MKIREKMVRGLAKTFGINILIQKNTNSLQGFYISESEMNDTYLFDFKNFGSLYNNQINEFPNRQLMVENGEESSMSNSDYPKKIAIKPIDVLNELETVPTPFSLLMIDEKLSVLEDKRKLIIQKYAKREIEALIERITNRKKYLEFKEFFDKFQNTTDEKIDNLLDKYDLEIHTSDIFVPEFPDIAINIMKQYTENLEKLCGKKPVFYVIAEPSKFRKAYEKRDPILLVQSPFGFYWQILGAWDAEMLLLSEL